MRVVLVVDVDVGLDAHVLIDPDFHQLDIVLDKRHLFLQRHKILLIIVEQVAQHFAQFVDGTLRLFGLNGDESVDIIERVEQKVWIELRAQIGEFRLAARPFRLAPLIFHAL